MTLPRFFDNRLNVLTYVVLPLCLGLAIALSDWRYAVGLAAILLFFYLSLRVQCYLFILSIFYPLVLTIGPINEFPIFLVITPLFFISTLGFMILNGESFRPGKDTRMFILALFLLLLCLIVGYVKNSFSFFSIDLGDHETKMIALAYIDTFSGILVFFSSLWFFSRMSYDENNLLKFFLIIAFSLIFFQLTGLFSQVFSVAFGSKVVTSQGAVRLGGFDTAIWLAIPALIAYSSQRLNIFRVLMICILLTLGIIGGGRTLVFGVVFTIIIYLALFHKKYSSRLVLAFGIIILATALIMQFVSTPEQLRRISGITLIESGGFSQEDPGRYKVFSRYWDVFLENPLFGKGIGVYKGKESDFVKGELLSGGHNAYLSILCIFGIAGGLFLGLMLFGGVFKSYRLVLMNNHAKDSFPYQKLPVFLLTYLLVTIFYYVFGSSGFKDIKLYFVIGMLLGIIEKKEGYKHLIGD